MKTPPQPLVSVILAVRDGERFVRQAVTSVLRQTIRDLEVLVIDDGSCDATPALLQEITDPRLAVVRNDEAVGLAAALNRGLDLTRGRYIARMDADDVAMPDRLERQLERLAATPRVAIVGSAVTEVSSSDLLGNTHLLPTGPVMTRWLSLFGTPFFHPTVVVERRVLELHGLRYDGSYDAGDASAEDYDLWQRVLTVAEGDNVPASLLLYRRHEGQASERRRDHQDELRRRIALRAIASVAPELEPRLVELAWRVGDARSVDAEDVGAAVDAHFAVFDAFTARFPMRRAEARAIRTRIAVAVVRAARPVAEPDRTALLRRALALDPALPVHAAYGRVRRRAEERRVRKLAPPLLAALRPPGRVSDDPPRVTIVSPEPTPFRTLLFDRIAERTEIDFRVVYAGRTIAGRRWTIVPRHRARFLRGLNIPGASKLLLHDYPVTVDIFAALRDARPDVVVVSGWSTFACQAAVFWCRVRRVPYILLVESHDAGPRAAWRRALKSVIVPRIVKSAAHVFVIGRLARESVLARGGRPDRIAWFANTIDVVEWGQRVDRLAGHRDELRAALGAGPDDVVVLCVARLSPEKGLETLVRAVAAAGRSDLLLVVAGEGPLRGSLEELAEQLGVRLVIAPQIPWERTAERYGAADIFALLSLSETWGVVVNEAAACGLPLVLSDRVGAAHDLLVDGENGRMVSALDVVAAGEALGELAADPDTRRVAGACSRQLMKQWGYGPSIESFVATVLQVANP